MFRIKATLSIILVLLLCSFVGNCFAYGESTTDEPISVTIGNASGAIGEEVVVPIDFANVPATGINNCDFRITYNTTALEFISGVWADFCKNRTLRNCIP